MCLAARHGDDEMPLERDGSRRIRRPVFVLGALLFVCRDPGARLGLSLAAIPVAVMAGAVPMHLIGMCGSPAMQCRTGTLPAVMIILALIALDGLVNVFVLKYLSSREQRAHETTYDLSYRLEQP